MTDLTHQEKRYLEEIRRVLADNNRNILAKIPKVTRKTNEDGDCLSIDYNNQNIMIPLVSSQTNKNRQLK